MRLSASYNAEADTAYVRFGDARPVARSVTPIEDVVIDLDRDGRIVGIEFVTASRILDAPTLQELRGV
jgi:uncharacterized protein YuzE